MKATKNRWSEIVLGPARDPLNPRVFHTITLAAFLAWVGLGADGLSSACYGPEEAFLNLGAHRSIAIPLALFVALTVFVISASYSILIALFPSGGGGYQVSTKLLGKGAGVTCGCALVLDYILTIAISISSGVAAIFSSEIFKGLRDRLSQHDLQAMLPEAPRPKYDGFQDLKLWVSLGVLAVMIVINLRGVKESIKLLLTIFMTFLLTHVVAIGAVFVIRGGELRELFASSPGKMLDDARQLGGWLPLIGVFFYAYSLGGGTFTGIEAVSNSMQILREPRVATGRRTMLYMAISLAITAAGLLLGYLLFGVGSVPGKTLNAVLFEGIFENFKPGGIPLGHVLVLITLLSEGALLFVAAEAGFIGGPRTLATMAHDRWVPTRFSQLSSRLVIQDGVLFMGLAAMIIVYFTHADVKVLMVLYAINVFLTFTLAQLGMCVHWLRTRGAVAGGGFDRRWKGKLAVNGFGMLLTALILVMMVWLKFLQGGWVTILLTAVAIGICYLVRDHYEKIRVSLRDLDVLLEAPLPPTPAAPPERDSTGSTAVLLVGGYNGLGVHSLFTVIRQFPNHFKNFVFVSVGVIDFDEFKSEEEIHQLQGRTVASLEKYVERACAMGFYAEHRHAFGTDLVDEIERLSLEIVRDYPGSIFFGGQLVFEHENLFARTLHSQTAFEAQRRLQFSGLSMVLLPVRMRLREGGMAR